MAIFNAFAAAAAAAGLEYETGTYQPTSDAAYYDIAFSDTHTEPPAFVLACAYVPPGSNSYGTNVFVYFDGPAFVAGDPNGTTYGKVYSSAGGAYNSAINITTRYNNTSSSHSQAAGYYISSTGFKPRYVSDSYNWSSSFPIKWIAIWPLYH